MVESGADINHANIDGTTPLMIACFHGKMEVVKYVIALYKQFGIHILPNITGESCLMYACQGGNLEVVNFLLNSGHNPNYVDKTGKPAVAHVCAYGHYNLTQLLVY